MEQRPDAKEIAEEDTGASRARLLIVDDLPSNVALLADALGDDYELYFATSGEEAVARATTKRVDLILLDIMMPEVDGYEVCRLLKLDPALAEVPVIFVTAKTGPDDELKGFAVGAVDYITKPISPPIVRARVRTHVALKSARDQLRALTRQDGLTGIPNRPTFEATLARELRRARLEGGRMAVLVLGLDHFGAYNALHGHLAGDRALQQVAAALTAGARERPLDLVARFSGDRFGVICPDTAGDTAEAVARDRLERVAALQLRGPVAGPTHLTASIGGLAIGPPWAQAPSAAELLTRAEGLLASAKDAGRNQLWIERLGAVDA
jgi:diguanylate cyclase (GGDEF)-like protein